MAKIVWHSGAAPCCTLAALAVDTSDSDGKVGFGYGWYRVLGMYYKIAIGSMYTVHTT